MLTVRYGWLGVTAGQRLLDFGCGGGRHALEAMRRGALATALDSDRKEIEGAAAWMATMRAEDKDTANSGGEGHVVVGDGRALPFPDACFDKVIAAEVMEHVPDDAAILAELARVLRPGGTMAVTVPRWFPEVVNWALSADYHKVPGGHVRIYRRAQLCARLRARRPGPGPVAPCSRLAQPVLVAALRRRRGPGGQPVRQGLPPVPGLGHDGPQPVRPLARGAAEPGLGQKPCYLLPKTMARLRTMNVHCCRPR